ncbi:hypothetical protein SeMB42_g03943 [Synchytrium endobioticum]|uniref:Protein ARV n=1 Tax=Synchytrium endobioticum TaxID=286115 RepID=A0A507D2W2_9FUNG|nr:hypothetical protein SeMB42_g03943 [Synchytrium endobioticum]TPX46869.1 hypothetical protein SeLEV6574_g02968 [Synchytrium endobioticum]
MRIVAMTYVCVECGTPSSSLYTEYSKGNIILTQCGKCLKFADKYLEFDGVLLFIDMVLLKPQVYRHLIYNVLETGDYLKLRPILPRLAFLFILFDVYLKWFKFERNFGQGQLPHRDWPLLYQYLYILSMSAFSFFSLLAGILFGAFLFKGWRFVKQRYDIICLSIVISSFGKLLPLLMVIWDYEGVEYVWVAQVFVLVSNMEALLVYLEAGRVIPLLIMMWGCMCQGFTQYAFWRWDPELPFIML